MKSRGRNIILAVVGMGVLLLKGAPAHASAIEAIAIDLDLTNIQLAGQISLTATPLPIQAFFGKNVVIPVEVVSNAPITDIKQIQASIFYQLVDPAGNPQGTWQSVPVQLQKDPQNNKHLLGTAVIQRSDFQSVKASGRLNYYFRALKGGQDVFLTPSLAGVSAGAGITAPPDSFGVSFIDTVQFSVPADGGSFRINDTYQVDGKTAVAFDPGALSGPGSLEIHQEDINNIPSGPRGLKAVNAFTFTLGGSSLLRSARITLSYPANADGTVTEEKWHWQDLALYGYTSPYGWQLLSRPETDPTLHTVTGITTHFSLFALFPSGPVSGADIRPRQRVLTPNGDGVNDTVLFTGLTQTEEVRLFDIRGRRVRTINGPPHIWDGKDDEGKVVESGIYLYQYTSQGDRVSGVILIAK